MESPFQHRQQRYEGLQPAPYGERQRIPALCRRFLGAANRLRELKSSGDPERAPNYSEVP